MSFISTIVSINNIYHTRPVIGYLRNIAGIFIHVVTRNNRNKNITKQEGPPAWTQEAYRPSDTTILFLSGRGVPLVALQGYLDGTWDQRLIYPPPRLPWTDRQV